MLTKCRRARVMATNFDVGSKLAGTTTTTTENFHTIQPPFLFEKPHLTLVDTVTQAQFKKVFRYLVVTSNQTYNHSLFLASLHSVHRTYLKLGSVGRAKKGCQE